ncbi:hypothetical protein AB5I41_25040 [Sphingomonas sp. MMS24-JH45]
MAKKSSDAVTKFLMHMEKVEAALPSASSDYAFTVRIDFDLLKKKDDAAVKAAVVGGAEADLTVVVEGDKVPQGFTWTYDELIKRLKERYADFKQNAEFHERMKPVKADPKLCSPALPRPRAEEGRQEGLLQPQRREGAGRALHPQGRHAVRAGAERRRRRRDASRSGPRRYSASMCNRYRMTAKQAELAARYGVEPIHLEDAPLPPRSRSRTVPPGSCAARVA